MNGRPSGRPFRPQPIPERIIMRVDAASGTRLLYNLRFRAILYQAIAVGSIVLLGLYLFSNVSEKLAEQNIATGFGYLSREAGFVISQAMIDYKPTDTYGRAILVGIVNTIWVSAWSVALATILGL